MGNITLILGLRLYISTTGGFAVIEGVLMVNTSGRIVAREFAILPGVFFRCISLFFYGVRCEIVKTRGHVSGLLNWAEVVYFVRPRVPDRRVRLDLTDLGDNGIHIYTVKHNNWF
jgi:hypothetical protein